MYSFQFFQVVRCADGQICFFLYYIGKLLQKPEKYNVLELLVVDEAAQLMEREAHSGFDHLGVFLRIANPIFDWALCIFSRGLNSLIQFFIADYIFKILCYFSVHI